MTKKQILERFEKKWNGGDDGLFVTEPMGTEEQKNKVKNFLSSVLTEQLEELERWVGGYKLIEKEQGFSNDINLFMSKDLYRKANGYNEAIDDTLSHIREQMEKLKVDNS